MANSNDTSKGIKGQCQLMRLSYVNMPIICPLEVMHSQFLGTTKSLIERWFGKDVLNKQWYKNLSNLLLNSLILTCWDTDRSV
ncbi:hypothetical protein BLOT_009794 [Blomia tropicalis]|nr:hypothetical protein BLOT_009794 [Blomia tropicalis]